jgi:GT2 family glycosyltransferase
LVDNNSSECSADLFFEKFPNIKLVKSGSNLGFSKGNNLGILQAEGNYVLLLNSDTELTENSIKIIYDFINTNEKAAVASPALIFPNGNYQSVCQRFPSIRYQLFELLRLQKLLPKTKAGKVLLGSFFDHTKNIKSDWVWGTCFMFKRKLLQRLPDSKLNEFFFMYFEDMQWCKDFKKLGYEIHYCSQTKVIHHMGGSFGKKTEFLNQNYQVFMKNNYNFIHRYFIVTINKLLEITQ